MTNSKFGFAFGKQESTSLLCPNQECDAGTPRALVVSGFVMLTSVQRVFSSHGLVLGTIIEADGTMHLQGDFFRHSPPVSCYNSWYGVSTLH